MSGNSRVCYSLPMIVIGCDCSPCLACRVKTADIQSKAHCACTASSPVSSLVMNHIKLKPPYTPPLKQTFRIIPSAHPLQEPPILLAVTLKRPLPLRAVVQVPISMSSLISRCGGIDLLHSAACRRLDELVIPALVPVDREAYDNERLMSAVVQAQWICIALACPIR